MELGYIFAKFLQFIQIPQVHNTKKDRTSKIRFQSLVVGCNIGKRSYISENSSVLYCDIGNYVSIASNGFIGGASHPVDWVSTSPVFQDCRSVLKQKINCKPYDPYTRTIIGNDVWIGTHSLIKAGVSIGDGAVIGMGSVVTHDVGPYEIWAGNPARMIRRRFSDDIIEELLKSEWWNYDDKTLEIYSDYISSPGKFVDHLQK